MTDQPTRRITLDVRPGNEKQALGLANHFIQTYPEHFRKLRPERRGVGYRIGDDSYFVYGDADHVRVKESIYEPQPDIAMPTTQHSDSPSVLPR